LTERTVVTESKARIMIFSTVGASLDSKERDKVASERIEWIFRQPDVKAHAEGTYYEDAILRYARELSEHPEKMSETVPEKKPTILEVNRKMQQQTRDKVSVNVAPEEHDAPDQEPSTTTKKYCAPTVEDEEIEVPFLYYPEELLKIDGWMVNYGKVPKNVKTIKNAIDKHHAPTHNELVKGIFGGQGWEQGDWCLSFSDANRQRMEFVKYYNAFGDNDHRNIADGFHLGILPLKYEDYIFLERDEVDELDEYGQNIFFDYCLSCGYFVSKSASGRAHYIVKLTPELKAQCQALVEPGKTGFKFQDKGKGCDFEISWKQGQWNETGLVWSKGSIIPGTDKVVERYIMARFQRRVERKGGKLLSTSTTTGQQVLVNPPSIVAPAITSDIPSNLLTDAPDETVIESLKKSKRIDRWMYEFVYEKQNLSDELWAFFKEMIKGGANLQTCIKLFYESALDKAYHEQERIKGEPYNEHVRPDKFERTFKGAWKEVQQNPGQQTQTPTVEVFTDEIQQEAKEVYESGRALEYMVNSVQEEHTGDEIPIKALFLSRASTGVKNGNGVHVNIRGSAGSGKSDVVDRVKERINKTAILPPGSFSDKSMFYLSMGTNPVLRAGCILHFDDQSLTPIQEEIMKARTSDFHQRYYHHSVKVDRTGSDSLFIPEECVQWLTCVSDNTDEQTKSRVITLRVDETEEQRKDVCNMILEDAVNPPDEERGESHTAKVCRAIWNLIKPETVAIPFAKRIKYDLKDETANRTIKIFLTLIRCVALMRAPIRERDEKGHIQASEDDYTTAMEIMNKSIETKSLDLTDDQVKLLELLVNPTDENYQDQINSGGEYEVPDREQHKVFVNLKLVSFPQFENIVHGRKRRDGSQDTGLDSVPGISFYKRNINGKIVNIIVVNTILYESFKKGGYHFMLEPIPKTKNE